MSDRSLSRSSRRRSWAWWAVLPIATAVVALTWALAVRSNGRDGLRRRRATAARASPVDRRDVPNGDTIGGDGDLAVWSAEAERMLDA